MPPQVKTLSAPRPPSPSALTVDAGLVRHGSVPSEPRLGPGPKQLAGSGRRRRMWQRLPASRSFPGGAAGPAPDSPRPLWAWPGGGRDGLRVRTRRASIPQHLWSIFGPSWAPGPGVPATDCACAKLGGPDRARPGWRAYVYLSVHAYPSGHSLGVGATQGLLLAGSAPRNDLFIQGEVSVLSVLSLWCPTGGYTRTHFVLPFVKWEGRLHLIDWFCTQGETSCAAPRHWAS